VEDFKVLEKYAQTPRQIQVLDAIQRNGGNVTAAARELRVAHQSLGNVLKAIRKRAAVQGYAPDYDKTIEIPDPFILKGTSTMYKVNADGSKTARVQWVKDRLDADQQRAMLEAAIQEAIKDLPSEKPVIRDLSTHSSDLLNMCVITDYHMGARAWAPETGSDWNLEIAEDTLDKTLFLMFKRAQKADTCLLAFLGDFLHFDGIDPVTPTNKHILDAAGRMEEIVRATIRAVRKAVKLARENHRHVIILFAEGNHDITSSIWVRHLLEALYEDCPDVEVLPGEQPYYVRQWGTTMLAFHHGHLTKKENLPQFFAAKHAPTWGLTTKRYIHTGHYHHLDEKGHAGARVYQHPTLAANDAHSARHGYVEDREAAVITYSKQAGQIARYYVSPEQLKDPDIYS
jgi:hypothetical protein